MSETGDLLEHEAGQTVIETLVALAILTLLAGIAEPGIGQPSIFSQRIVDKETVPTAVKTYLRQTPGNAARIRPPQGKPVLRQILRTVWCVSQSGANQSGVQIPCKRAFTGKIFKKHSL